MELIFAGASHCGVSGYISVTKFFDKIYLIRDNTQEILDIKREQDEIIEDFESEECAYVFLCGYERLISKEELERKIYINIHESLLPKYRGMHPTFYAIMNNEKKLGITFHLVNQFMDAGDIIAQYSFPYVGQTVKEINSAIDKLVYEQAGRTLADYIKGNIAVIPQKEEEALYGTKRNLDDCLIDFNMEHEMLERFFCALTKPYPNPLIKVKGIKYEVQDHILVYRDYYGPIGRACNIDDRGVWIKTKEGFLIIKNVKKVEDSSRIELSDLVKIGYRFSGGYEDLKEVNEALNNFLMEYDIELPFRWKKAVALYYPDAVVRKKYFAMLNLNMGEGTFANPGLCTDATVQAPVNIGRNVSIASNVCFITQSEPNNSERLKEIPEIQKRLIKELPISVGDDVWIGAGVIILPGVSIGKCSIIGAGAVVIDDVEEYSIYAGVPAKKIRDIKH